MVLVPERLGFLALCAGIISALLIGNLPLMWYLLVLLLVLAVPNYGPYDDETEEAEREHEHQ